MKHPLNFKLLVQFAFGFILCTIIGTLSHELGHVSVARILGYETTLHYGSMNWDTESHYKELRDIYSQYKTEIESGLDFPRKEELKMKQKKVDGHTLLILLGGPVQTMLTGTFGLLFLYWRRKFIRQYSLKLIDWAAIFMALFWLREAFNLLISVAGGFFSGRYFGGDEFNISQLLELPGGAIPIISGILGMMLSAYTVFKWVPKNKRFTFILGGFAGGISGFVLWMYILGPVLLP